MTILQTGVSLPLNLKAGETLVIKELSGTSTVTGSVASREDASASIGAGFVVYGPQSSDCSVTISTTGVCDWVVRVGDATPTTDTIKTLKTANGQTVLDDASRLAVWNGAQSIYNFSAADKLYSLNNSNWGNGGTTTRTSFFKREAEAPFSRVRLWIIKRTDASESIASGNWSAIIAPTETAADDTQSNRYYPINGGAAQNAAVNQANPAGWRTVTWSGASTAQITGTSDVNKPLFLASDWIDCRSIPRADGGARPLLLCRVRMDGTTGTYSRYTGFTNWSTNAASAAYYRIMAAEWINSDGISSLTTTPAGTQYGNFGFTAFWEFDYDVPCRSYYIAGDSLFASSNGSTTAEFDGWATRAIYAKSTTAAPIILNNGGFAARTTQDFIDNGLIAHINAGGRPTDVVILGGSGNDTSAFTEFGNNNARSAIMRGIKAAKAINSRVILTTTPPRAYSGSQETFRLAQNAWVRSVCSSGLATLFDFDQVLSDNASPARLQTAYNSGDNVHPSAAGTAALAASFSAFV